MRKREFVLLIAALLCSACGGSDDKKGPKGPTGPTIGRPEGIVPPAPDPRSPAVQLPANCDPNDVDVVDWRHDRQYGNVSWNARITAPRASSDCTFNALFKVQVKQSGNIVGRIEVGRSVGGVVSADHWVCGGGVDCHIATLPNENGAYQIAFRWIACSTAPSAPCPSFNWPD